MPAAGTGSNSQIDGQLLEPASVPVGGAEEYGEEGEGGDSEQTADAAY